MRESALHVGQTDGLGAVPVEEAILAGKFFLGAVEVIFV